MSWLRGFKNSHGRDDADPNDDKRAAWTDGDGVLPGALLGYRSWIQSPASECLISTGDGKTAWRPGVNIAYCLYYLHRAPDADCSCGFYALHEPDPKRYWGGEIIGALAARGEVQIHKHGWRAEEVQIVGLCEQGLNRSSRKRAREMSERYGVPLLKTLDDLKAYAEGVAQPAPREMIEALPDPDDQAAMTGVDHSRRLVGAIAGSAIAWLITLLWLAFSDSYGIISSEAEIWFGVSAIIIAFVGAVTISGTLASRIHPPGSIKRALLLGISPRWAAMTVLISAASVLLIAITLSSLSKENTSPLSAVNWERLDPDQLPTRSEDPKRTPEVVWPAEDSSADIGEIREFRIGRWMSAAGQRAGGGLAYAKYSPVASAARIPKDAKTLPQLTAPGSWIHPALIKDAPSALPLVSPSWATKMALLADHTDPDPPSSEQGALSDAPLQVITEPTLQKIRKETVWSVLVGPHPTPEIVWFSPDAASVSDREGVSPYQAVFTSVSDGSTEYVSLRWGQIRIGSLQQALSSLGSSELVLRGGEAMLRPRYPSDDERGASSERGV